MAVFKSLDAVFDTGCEMITLDTNEQSMKDALTAAEAGVKARLPPETSKDYVALMYHLCGVVSGSV